MKKRACKFFSLVLPIIAFCTHSLFAQVDVKARPVIISTLFRNIVINADYTLKKELSIETGVFFNLFHEMFPGKNTFKVDYFGFDARLKYYFKPDKGTDKYYLGTYAYRANLNISDLTEGNDYYERTAFGLQPGYKIFIKDKYIVDLGIQFGKAFTNKNGLQKTEDGSNSFNNFILNYDINYVFNIGYRFARANN